MDLEKIIDNFLAVCNGSGYGYGSSEGYGSGSGYGSGNVYGYGNEIQC